MKLHNQKHHILADAVDLSQCNGTSKSQWLDAEAKINTWIPAVGCKLFQSPGPTQCSKLKIFRPKTTINQAERKESVCEKRPKTAPRNKRLSEMDLAIYWDVSTPVSKATDALPSPEAKNDSTLSVIAPAEEAIKSDEPEKQTIPAAPEAIDTIHDEIISTSRKHSLSNSTSGSQRKEETRKSISNLSAATSDRAKPTSLSDVRCRKKYASAPNLVNIGVQVNPSNFRTTARICEACNVIPSRNKLPITSAEPYKLAFKAGMPNTMTVDDRTLERLHKARHLIVPKPKMPYTKKSYSIGTLMPPFSVWPRAAGQDYPDHWRLVSVYQHSYKPLETRKAPLIKTVFQ